MGHSIVTPRAEPGRTTRESTLRVDFWFHPGCPWTWVTSRWLLDVAPERDLDVHWRSFSLTLLNGCADVPKQYKDRAEGAHDILRVVEAARHAGEHQSAIGEFYTGAGRELFSGTWPLHVPDTLAAAGMDPSLAGAYSDSALGPGHRSLDGRSRRPLRLHCSLTHHRPRVGPGPCLLRPRPVAQARGPGRPRPVGRLRPPGQRRRGVRARSGTGWRASIPPG